MKNFSIPLLVLLLVGWILAGPFIFKMCGCCGLGLLSNPLLIKDGGTVAAAADDNVVFNLSDSKPIISEDVNGAYGKLASYLKAHPEKAVLLTGLYAEGEKGAGTKLGLGRAESIKATLLALGVSGQQLLTNGALGKDLVADEEKIVGGINYNFLNRYIDIKDGAQFSTNIADNFTFPVSSFEYNEPLSEKMTGGFEKVATYLKDNPNRTIVLTGQYTDKENNTSVLPDLGLARANRVKQILTGMGVGATQVNIASNRVETTPMVFDGNWFGGVNYSFTESEAKNEDALAAVKARLAKPAVLYFETNKDNILLSDDQRQYFADLIYYLDRVSTAKVTATGHTDNIGNPNGNRRLGKRRANFVRDYLIKNGIGRHQIVAQTEGPDKPIASNDTEDGRAKNRRVEISVK